MIPRQRLDIGWADILTGVYYCFTPGNREAAHDRIAESWSSVADTVVSISERSSFDLVLESLNLPAGSEILMTAMNIKPMFEAIERHGLVAVPVDLDMATLAAEPELLEDSLSGNTRAILVAQLFGSRHPVDSVVAFARKHDLFMFEDCAQAFSGDGYTGHPGADAAMFSFGPIKTCSTIMGGVTKFKDPALAADVKRLQAQWPVHSRWGFMLLLLRFAVLITFMRPWLFSLTMRVAKRLGMHNSKLNSTVRVFAKNEWKQCQQQASYPVLRLLDRRLKRFDTRYIDRRKAAAQTVIDRLPASVFRPAQDAAEHSYWIFPAQVSNPVALMKHLRRQGFDSINSYSSFIVPKPAPGEPDQVAVARRCMAKVLYLPVHTGVPERELIRLAACITAFEEKMNSEPAGPERQSATDNAVETSTVNPVAENQTAENQTVMTTPTARS